MSSDLQKAFKKLLRKNKELILEAKNRTQLSTKAIIWHQVIESKYIETKQRLIIILNSRGCRYALKETGPCFNCGLVTASSLGQKVSLKDMSTQLKTIRNHYNFNNGQIVELDLFNSGSMLDEWQVASNVREALFKEVVKMPSVKDILIDSRPEDINEAKLKSITKIIRNKKLWVGIGLESINDQIRNLSVNKGFSVQHFEDSIRILKQSGCNLFVYQIFKPAFITEQEAITDAIETARYIHNIARKYRLNYRISLEPAVIQGDCLMRYLYEKNLYKTPWLWSIIEVIKKTQPFTKGRLRVGIPEEVPKVVDRRKNYNINGNKCPCTDEVEKCIHEYNKKRSLDVFKKLPKCTCKERWQLQLQKDKKLIAFITLEDRIKKIAALI